MKIAYIACPYSDIDPSVQEARHAMVNQVACKLMQEGTYVYSPLTHDIPLSKLGLHGNWQTWMVFDHEMLSRCDELIVLRLSGWDSSLGVQAEINCAKSLGKKIRWLDFDEGKLTFS